MSQELQHPFVVDRIEESTNVRVEYPVHLPLLDAHPQRIQGVVAAASGSKPVAEADKVLLVNLFEHGLDGPLDNLVFQGCYAQGTLTPIGLENPRSLGGLCLVGTSMDPSVKVRQAVLQAVS